MHSKNRKGKANNWGEKTKKLENNEGNCKKISQLFGKKGKKIRINLFFKILERDKK